jgi:hypothetical protein
MKQNTICKIFITIILFGISTQVYGQRFLLTDIPSVEFSIDRIAQQVYFKDFYSDTVRIVDLKTMALTTIDDIRYLTPVFGNTQHFMLSFPPGLAFSLYNISDQSSYTPKDPIPDSLGYMLNSDFHGCFSPSDRNILFSNCWYYLSINDSTIRSIDKNLYIEYYAMDAYPQWSSDTSFVFISDGNVILEYNINTKTIDTLVVWNARIDGFSYNVKYNILAYSTPGFPPEIYPKIYFHYRNSTPDVVIFSPTRDDPNDEWWGESGISIFSLAWSPNNERLAFFSRSTLNSMGGLFISSIDSNRIYKIFPIGDEGIKYRLHWANNDTLLYLDASNDYITGMDISPFITSVEVKDNNNIVSDFKVTNYPNPFNNSTRIAITLPKNTNGTLSIYNIQGSLVKEYSITNNGKNDYEVVWDGLNDYRREVSSGIYLGILQLDNPNIKNSKIAKIIYLK